MMAEVFQLIFKKKLVAQRLRLSLQYYMLVVNLAVAAIRYQVVCMV